MSTADVAINFVANYSAFDLAIQSETYSYLDAGDLKIQLFQYYVSDLELLPADGGDPVRLSEIELIRYASATEDNLEARSYTVPTGRYAGVRFGLGVKPELNSQPPSNFAANDPLNENEFWNERARYVFAKIEANMDLERDGTFNTPLTLHMGSNDLYRTVTLDREFTIREGETSNVDIVADIFYALNGGNRLYSGAGLEFLYDVTDPDNQRVHGGNQATATTVFEGLARQFTLD